MFSRTVFSTASTVQSKFASIFFSCCRHIRHELCTWFLTSFFVFFPSLTRASVTLMKATLLLVVMETLRKMRRPVCIGV